PGDRWADGGGGGGGGGWGGGEAPARPRAIMPPAARTPGRMQPMEGTMKFLRRLIQLAILFVLVQALREHLSRPPEERTWSGRVGPVPYDFRMPTLDRVLAAY